MANRRGNMSFGNRNFGGSPNKKNMQNQNQNRNRPSGGKSNNFGNNNMGNQVSPWLSQSTGSNNAFGAAFGRSMPNDQQTQLALAKRLLSTFLTPELSKLAPPRPLLSLGHSHPSSSSSYGGDSSGFNRNRFGGYGRPNAGKVQKDFKRGDFKNKRFGNERKHKKNDQFNRKSTEEKNTEKKEVVKKEDVTVEKMDVEQSASEKVVEVKVEDESSPNDAESKSEDVKPSPDEPKVNYSDIPAALLFCHICRKHMWDDSSFEKHLEGRPHKMMVEELDRSYKLKVELLRHEMRVMEQQRENDIQRAQRKGKSNVKMQQRDFCNMCNLSFLGMLPAHRKNERHQRLKKFLHPKCNMCLKEFYTRLEWDDHKLTPAHLKRLAEIRKENRPDLENTEFDIIDFIEDINDEFDMDNIEVKVVGKRETLDELQSEKCEVTDISTEDPDKDGDKEERAEEDEEKKLPKYSPGIPVGENFVVEKTGSLCRACNKFILTQEDVKIHCQTLVHYNNIIKIWKAQNKIVRKRRLNETKAEEEKKREESTTDQETSCKRLKVDEPSTEVNGSTTEQEVTVKSEIESGEDKYDPEHPESENEKDQEKPDDNTVTSEAKQVSEDISDKIEPKLVLDDVAISNGTKPEVKVEEEIAFEPPKVENKPPNRASPRAPRARRGRGRRN